MTLPGHLRNRTSFGELALWASAGLVAFAAHAGAVAVMLQEPPLAAADSAPPAAIMIELAAEAEAIETEENQIVPDQVDAEEIKSATAEPPKEPTVEPPPEPTPEPLPEPPPEPLPEPEPEPVEKVEEPPPEPIEQPDPPPPEEVIEEVDPIEEMALAQLENVEVPLPMTRPPVPEKVKEKPRKVEQKAAPAASQAARKAKAEVKQSNRVAAAQTSSTAGSASVSPAKWQSRLMSHLERRKRYPSESRKNKEEGTAYVRFTVDTSGNVTSVSLSRSSGYPSLDKAVVDMVRRASPVPAPPPGANRTIVAPVRFNLR